jgi:hypothetical protein
VRSIKFFVIPLRVYGFGPYKLATGNHFPRSNQRQRIKKEGRRTRQPSPEVWHGRKRHLAPQSRLWLSRCWQECSELAFFAACFAPLVGCA